jgi:hypothetical protein
VDKRGTTHFFYEFKERDAPFRLVDHSGTKDFSVGSNSPFGHKNPMSPLQEEDDESEEDGPPATISTPMKEAVKKGAAKARASNISASYRDTNADSSSCDDSTLPSVEGENMDVDDDESSSGGSTVSEDTKAMFEAFKKLRKQSRKKKNSKFGIGTTNSHRSGTTRGDSAREEKRKSKNKSQPINDNSSKASSKKSSKSSKSKSNATSYTCLNTFEDESKKHD